jgi:hypothetical protein
MAFDTLKIAELRKIAQGFGVDASAVKTKKDVIALLEEEGVTWEMYEGFSNSEKEEIENEEIEVKAVKPLKSSDQILVRMDRKNFSYQTFGYHFTAEHPFVAMPESIAQMIFDTEEGFRPATPREVQEYYS